MSLGQNEIEILDEVLDKAKANAFAKQMGNMPELVSFTFEGNTIKDEAAVCALFGGLAKFEKLENLNIRCNRFNGKLVEALCKSIANKKELRVRKKKI